MADINNSRITFKRGGQRAFISDALHILACTPIALGKKLGVGERAVRDWRKERYTMSYGTVKKICYLLNLSLPENISLRPQYWYAAKAAELGGKALFKKYGRVAVSESYRKIQWKKWWKKVGHRKMQRISKKPSIKPRYSAKLAEFTGIMMGDGTISPYQICVTLHRKDDYGYSLFVKKLMTELFEVTPSHTYRKYTRAMDIRISRVDVVNFCHKVLDLPIGHKIQQGLDIPKWILENRTYSKSCLRGLIDTDGSIIVEIHRIKFKSYSYPRINFTTYSPRLSKTILKLLIDLGFSPKSRRDGKSIQLENIEEICDYFSVVGSHNPKHLKRIRKYLRG